MSVIRLPLATFGRRFCACTNSALIHERQEWAACKSGLHARVGCTRLIAESTPRMHTNLLQRGPCPTQGPCRDHGCQLCPPCLLKGCVAGQRVCVGREVHTNALGAALHRQQALIYSLAAACSRITTNQSAAAQVSYLLSCSKLTDSHTQHLGDHPQSLPALPSAACPETLLPHFPSQPDLLPSKMVKSVGCRAQEQLAGAQHPLHAQRSTGLQQQQALPLHNSRHARAEPVSR